ncbi:MAG: helix-turn-helix transcriptional regulator [Patescibacteria group bacterium]
MLPHQRLRKSNTIENLWLYILSLAKISPIYAYSLQKDIKEKFGFRPGKITPYRVLYRLEKKGFVISDVKDKRRFYKITKSGERELGKAKFFLSQLVKIIS